MRDTGIITTTCTIANEEKELEFFSWGYESSHPHKEKTILNFINKYKIKNLFSKIKYKFQIISRGYSDYEWYELYSNFIDRYSKIINHYKNNYQSYPHYFSSEQEWKNILEEMLLHLYYMNEDNINEEIYKQVPRYYILAGESLNEILIEHRDKFFELFSKYFYDL